MNQFANSSSTGATMPNLSTLIPIKLHGIDISIHQSIQEIPYWDSFSNPDNIFQQRRFLQMVEENPPLGMRFCYVVAYQNQEPVGMAAFQIIHFNASNSLQEQENSNVQPCFFQVFGEYFKGLLARNVDFDSLVCGSLLITGEYGFYFPKHLFSQDEQFAIVQAISEEVTLWLKKNRQISVSLTLMKDFFESSRETASVLSSSAYKEFTVNPNMIMDLPSEWLTFDDYMKDLHSKYRVRAKRAFKKLGTLQNRLLTAEDLAKHADRIYKLYDSISKTADFNVMRLNKRYFLALHQALPNEVKIHGYFDGEQLVAFYTIIKNGNELEAHFLGFDANYNPTHQIYLNILFNIIQEGISLRSHRIIFARTAMEIKSSVGAIAYPMYCYMRHNNSFVNRFINPILEYLQPNEDWLPRHPFKEHEDGSEDV